MSKKKAIGRRIAALRKLKGFSRVSMPPGRDRFDLSLPHLDGKDPAISSHGDSNCLGTQDVSERAVGGITREAQAKALSRIVQRALPDGPSRFRNRAEVARTDKRFTPRQLRLIRWFTGLVQEGDPGMVKALEALIEVTYPLV